MQCRSITEADLDQMENESICNLIRYTGDSDKHLTAYLMQRNRGFIYNQYRPFRPFIPESDVDGIGFIATCGAVQRYNADRGTFLQVLRFELLSELQEAVSQSFLIRIRPADSDILRCYIKALQQVEQDGTEVDDEIIQQISGLDNESLQKAKTAYCARNPSYLDAPISTDQEEQITLADVLPDDTASCFAEDVERKADSDALRDVFASMVAEMPEDMQAVIMYRLLGATASQIAKIMHCEVKDVRRLQRQAEKRLSMPSNKSKLMQYIETANLFTGSGVETFKRSFTSSTERSILRITDNDD